MSSQVVQVNAFATVGMASIAQERLSDAVNDSLTSTSSHYGVPGVRSALALAWAKGANRAQRLMARGFRVHPNLIWIQDGSIFHQACSSVIHVHESVVARLNCTGKGYSVRMSRPDILTVGQVAKTSLI